MNDAVEAKLDDISRELERNADALEKLDQTLYRLGEWVSSDLRKEIGALGSTVREASAHHGLRETRDLISYEAGMLRLWLTLFAVLTGASLIAILGTLRNWF